MSTPASSVKVGVQLPGVVGTHVDRVARHHGTAERLVSQLDAPDDVPPGRRIPVDRRIARSGPSRRLGLWRDGRRGHDGAKRQALQARRRRSDRAPTRPRHASRDRLRPLAAPPGPPAPLARCCPAHRPRRCARRGIHPSGLRSAAAPRTARRGRCWRGLHPPPIGRRESDRPGLGRDPVVAAPAFGPMDASASAA